MNKCLLLGRVCKDYDLRKIGEKDNCSFQIAVDRGYKAADGTRPADFLNIICWNQLATFSHRFFQKGARMLVIASAQSRTYKDKDDKTVYVTEFVAENIEFVDLKKDNANQGNAHSNISDGIPASSREKIEGLLPPEVKDDIYPDFGGDGLLPFDL